LDGLQRISKVSLGERSQVHRCEFSVADFDARGLAHQSSFSASFGRKIGMTLNPLRFRGNIYVSRLEPWQELDWIDKEFQIGRIHVRGLARTPRCAAVNVNPDTAIRDANLPKAISQNFGHVDLGSISKYFPMASCR
jgi:uncharacterized protein YcbX